MKKIKLVLVSFLFVIVSLASQATFESLNFRHVSPLDALKTMNDRFPWIEDGTQKSQEIVNCQQLSGRNSNALGVSSASTGKSIQKRPQAAFLNWYFDCLNTMATQRFTFLDKHNDIQVLGGYLPAEIIEKYGSSVSQLKTMHWSELNEEQVKIIIFFNLEKAIGPEVVLQDLKSTDTFELKTKRILKALEKQKKSRKLLPTLKWIVVATMMQPESLRY